MVLQSRPWSLFLLLLGWQLGAANPGDEVVVVFNRKVPASKQVAEHYAVARRIPLAQVFGFDLPVVEEISRAEYREQLQKPLLRALEENGLMVYASGANALKHLPVQAKIRYVALCYGVPVKISSDPSIKEPDAEKTILAPVRHNYAAVDSELACLPMNQGEYMLTGPIQSAGFGRDNPIYLNPTNGLLMVTRLDGPSPEIAMGLVDKAMEAETNGYWGRAYLDLQGLTNGPLYPGDAWLRSTAEVCTRAGMETLVDSNQPTFKVSFPLSHVAFYAGWYDQDVSGPFTRPRVDFMPGAIAYHLHSFSASSIRSTNKFWVGPLLAKGATATMGTVYEPYLSGTPHVTVFALKLFQGRHTFGEAAYFSQPLLSWQTTWVGDPLYRPAALPPPVLHSNLVARGSKLVEWSHLKVVNLNLAMKYPATDAIGYLEPLPETRSSAVLTEKLADLYWQEKKYSAAVGCYFDALDRKPSPEQRVRLTLNLAECLAFLGRETRMLELFENFLTLQPDYPDKKGIYARMAALSRKLGETQAAERYQRLAEEN